MLFAYVVHVTVCVVYMLSCVQCVTLIQQMMCFTTGDIWSLVDRWTPNVSGLYYMHYKYYRIFWLLR